MEKLAKYWIAALFIVGLILGFAWGATATMNWVIRRGLHFVEMNGLDLDVDEEKLIKAIWYYKDKITMCFPD